MKDQRQETRDSAGAQIQDASAFMLASVGSDGMLKFAVLAGTAAEDGACAVQCRSFAIVVEGIMAADVIGALQAAGGGD